MLFGYSLSVICVECFILICWTILNMMSWVAASETYVVRSKLVYWYCLSHPSWTMTSMSSPSWFVKASCSLCRFCLLIDLTDVFKVFGALFFVFFDKWHQIQWLMLMSLLLLSATLDPLSGVSYRMGLRWRHVMTTWWFLRCLWIWRCWRRYKKRDLTQRNGIVVDYGIWVNQVLVSDHFPCLIVVHCDMQFIFDTFFESDLLSNLMTRLLIIVNNEFLKRTLLVLSFI